VASGRVGEGDGEDEAEREPCCSDLDFLACRRRCFICCCCCLTEVGEMTTVEDDGAVGVEVGLLVALFIGACIEAIKPHFPEAKFARAGRFLAAEGFLAR